MRENELLSPHRPVKGGEKRTHDGRITTDEPDRMWGLLMERSSGLEKMVDVGFLAS